MIGFTLFIVVFNGGWQLPGVTGSKKFDVNFSMQRKLTLTLTLTRLK